MGIRYAVGRGWAERVNDTTALPHRILEFDEYGDATVHLRIPSRPELNRVIHLISAAELALLAREHRRAARRRFWARIIGRR